MIENFSETLFSSSLLDQAAHVLQLQLSRKPEDVDVLARLAEVYRKQGRLSDAAEVYAKLVALDPSDDNVSFLRSLMAGDPLPVITTKSEFRPAPFVVIRDYLPHDFHQTLLPFVAGMLGQFSPSRVGTETATIKPQYSHSLTLSNQEDLYQKFRETIHDSLGSIFPRLQLAPFKVAHIEVEIKAYGDGHFFRVHQDQTAAVNRVINFGYFFHRLPRPYSGGDFLLFDTDFSQRAYFPTRFTRITPEDNCVVFYPSASFHEVTPIRCPSGDFADSRFAIVGHICA